MPESSQTALPDPLEEATSLEVPTRSDPAPLSRGRALALASQIETLAMFVATLDLEGLVLAREVFSRELGQYEANGILDGNPRYFDRLKDMAARLARLDAIIALARVSRDTEADILATNPLETAR
jgi:hypothetical protein